ncbi:hypothetical protein BDY19DRAFT_988789 [Irpex rosettiformis]|uniref:Uncharacterized protein n=1 Tax=Irpex rosettiformis TaxID=378272 RepID=A0ACB8UL34_9APHY|nr:hypothetical protein BDY19DRAFT_988789 [Irpex rosettiformis]
MSKTVGAVEEPEIVDDEGEESDDYDDIEEEDDEDAGVEENENDDDDDGEEDEDLTDRGSNLTALLLGGLKDNKDEELEDEELEDEGDDEEYTPVDTKGAATAESAPPPAVGIKRTREEDEPDGEELSGDYGESEENSVNVKKKAKATVEGV